MDGFPARVTPPGDGSVPLPSSVHALSPSKVSSALHRRDLVVVAYILVLRGKPTAPHHALSPSFQIRSRSNSSSSREKCKDCARKKEQWKDHLCLRHAPCMDSDDRLWEPDRCEPCSSLLAGTVSRDSREKSKSRDIVREILRGAEAVAARRNFVGFVTAKTFHERFQSWMGALHNRKVIRRDPDEARRPSPSSKPKDAPSPAPSRSAALPRRLSPRDKERQSAARESTTPGPRSKTSEQAQTPAAPGPSMPSISPPRPSTSSWTPRAGTSKVTPQKTAGKSPKGRDPMEMVEALQRQLADAQRQIRESRSRERRSKARSPRSPTPCSSMSRSSSRESFSSGNGREYYPDPPRGERTPSPPRRTGSLYDLFESDSDLPRERERRNIQERRGTPEAQEEEEMTAEVGEQEPDWNEFYWLPSDARLDDTGLSIRGLAAVPKNGYRLETLRDRPVVSFVDPTHFPALAYAIRLVQVGEKTEPAISQGERVRALNQIVHVLRRSHILPWHTDTQVKDPLVLDEADLFEEFAHTVSQAKGYGDESMRIPSSPHVPLRSLGGKLQGLLNFLEAPPLSPTSHRLHKRYGDRRATKEPPRHERELDAQYRRIGRASLGLRLAWELMRKVLDSVDLTNQASEITLVKHCLEAFTKDADLIMDHQVTRAVHHRRNLIDMATRDMPQEDIRNAIQDLPLPTSTSLFHESAADTVERSLLRPEGRQLASIRPLPKFQGHRFPRSDRTQQQQQRKPRPTVASGKPSPTHQAPTRKRTRPIHPTAPHKRSRPVGEASQGGRGPQRPWKPTKPSTSRKPKFTTKR